MKGVYVLIIQIDKAVSESIGALGEVAFRQGLYAYVGSAQKGVALRAKLSSYFWL